MNIASAALVVSRFYDVLLRSKLQTISVEKNSYPKHQRLRYEMPKTPGKETGADYFS